MNHKTTAIRRTRKKELVGEKARRAVFRNIRPLGIFSSAAIAAAGFFATGGLHPGIAMGPLAFASLHTALNSFSTANMLKENRRPLSAKRLAQTGALDTVAAVVCLSQVMERGDQDIKKGLVVGLIASGFSLAAHLREKEEMFTLLKEKFSDPFQSMEAIECSAYLKLIEKKEKSWYMQPYWALRPEKFLEMQEEKGKVAKYLFTKIQVHER
ncbi:MAG: hypothetical protein ACLFUZ_00455 [Candidatus Micrarchaeia archaeon]